MDFKELKRLSPDGLRQALMEAQTRLRSLHAQIASHQLTRVRDVRVCRRQIARIRTLLNQS
ncbi:50S ribosomal protein L29 [Candidatus Uhrbacteria bacterium]|nr:50S ribosomal protein L29 [Candidatus Uhrbacteria bacterium]